MRRLPSVFFILPFRCIVSHSGRNNKTEKSFENSGKSKISLAFGGKRIPRVIFHRKNGDGAAILDKNEKCVEIEHEIWYTEKKR